jgi:Fe-Mn family superoxide dismutase
MGNRRDFIKKTGLLGLGTIAATAVSAGEKFSGFLPDVKIDLPPLPYAYDALEPFIDKQTMEIHHTKHHQAYIDKLNSAPAGSLDLSLSPEANCKKIDASTSPLIRNNLGGHYNHSLFWQLLRPSKGAFTSEHNDRLNSAIDSSFGSMEKFKAEFTEKSTKIFGSGWCWLIVDGAKKLKIITTPNQDNPLMQVASEQGTPVLGLDVWEHAYYLKYQNKRADYITAWWNVVNWPKVAELHKQA